MEDLPKRAPEHMIKDVKDPQLRLRIYRSAFSSMKNAILEKAREFGVPVVLVNPSHTSTVCPVHGAKIVYQPDGGDAPRVGVCGKGKERWQGRGCAVQLGEESWRCEPRAVGLEGVP